MSDNIKAGEAGRETVESITERVVIDPAKGEDDYNILKVDFEEKTDILNINIGKVQLTVYNNQMVTFYSTERGYVSFNPETGRIIKVQHPKGKKVV